MGYTKRQIVIDDLVLPVSIGIHEGEREAPQPLAITLSLDLAPPDPPGRDHIDAVLDYDRLRDGIRALVRARHYDLQETLGHAIVGLCLRFPAVVRVTVGLRKTSVYPDCAGVGITLVYER